MANVTGTSAADILQATAAVDTITGAGGTDRITGTAANLNGDTITDFGANDQITITDARPLNGFIEFNGGALVYNGTTINLPGLAAGVFVASPYITGGVALAHYAPRSIAAAGSATNTALTYGGINLDAAGITLTNTSSGRILYRGVAMNRGGSTFVNESGGQVELITGSVGDDTVVNRGTIFGSVTLGDGRDMFVAQGNTATVNPISLGSGADTLRITGAYTSFAALGGDGVDSVILDTSRAIFDGSSLFGFEQATVAVAANSTSNIKNLSGFTAISFQRANDVALVNLISAINPLVDLSIDGIPTVLQLSDFRSVIGGANADHLQLTRSTNVTNGVNLAAGDDSLTFEFFRNQLVASIGGALDGGAGTDRAYFTMFEEGLSTTVDLVNLVNFEKLLFNTGYTYPTDFTIRNVRAEILDISIGQRTGLTVNASRLTSTNIDAVFGTRLVIAADSLIASIYSVNARLFGVDLDTPEGDFAASSQILINGQVTGDIEMGPGDDTVDASIGTVGGTIFGNGGDDILLANQGGNRLVGGYGNDSLKGGLGNDTLEGGPGTDTAMYLSTRAEATITRNANGTLTVASAKDGSDMLSGVEKLMFGETTYIAARFADPGPRILADFTPGAGGWSSQDRFTRVLADVNGDGRTDIVGFGQAGTLIALRQSDDTFANAYSGTADFGVSKGWASDNTFHRELADVNGDGRDDIVGFGVFGVQVALSQTLVKPGDGPGSTVAYDGFGAAVIGSSNFNQANGWSSQDSFARTLGDVNGDGFADVVGFGTNGTFVSLGDGKGKFGAAAVALNNFGQAQGWTSDNTFHRELADVNGDGRDDIVGFGALGTLVALAQANGTFATAKLALENFGVRQGWSSQDAFTRTLADVNGDGRADVVGFGIAGTYVAYGRADGAFTAANFDVANFGRNQGWTSDTLYHRALADIQGDGQADIIGFGANGVFMSTGLDGTLI